MPSLLLLPLSSVCPTKIRPQSLGWSCLGDQKMHPGIARNVLVSTIYEVLRGMNQGKIASKLEMWCAGGRGGYQDRLTECIGMLQDRHVTRSPTIIDFRLSSTKLLGFIVQVHEYCTVHDTLLEFSSPIALFVSHCRQTFQL